jgi:bacillithiol system protein YtxJ
MAKARLEDKWQDHFNIKTYYLDLIAYRSVSNEIAEIFNITHESPQVIVINKQEAIINLTHSQISVQAILEKL